MKWLVLAVVVAVVAGCGRPQPPYPIPTWNCKPYQEDPPAQDVYHLQPKDIKAIMSLGDSISAGFAMYSDFATEDLLDLVEYRGSTFQSGGDTKDCNGRDIYSVPNFIKNYNPNLQGASHGNSLPLDAIKWKNNIIQPFDPKITHLNAAQSMAKIDALPAQVDYLVKELQTTYNQTVDFHNDWKMLTILIGANNLCGACKNRSYADPIYFGNQLDLVLTQINNTIPRTFVNVISVFNISNVYPVAKTSPYCMFMWKHVVASECMCMQGDATDQDRQIMDEHTVLFNVQIDKVVQKWQSYGLSQFGVFLQPMLTNLNVPMIDFISELDCFHPSDWADGAFAIGLWNNMLTPQAKKNNGINPENMGEIMCPGPGMYFQ